MILGIVLAMAGLAIAVLLEFKIHKEDRTHQENCPNCKDVYTHRTNCRRCKVADWLQV